MTGEVFAVVAWIEVRFVVWEVFLYRFFPPPLLSSPHCPFFFSD